MFLKKISIRLTTLSIVFCAYSGISLAMESDPEREIVHTPQKSLSELPDDILLNIIDYLPLDTLVSSRRVDKHFLRIANHSLDRKETIGPSLNFEKDLYHSNISVGDMSAMVLSSVLKRTPNLEKLRLPNLEIGISENDYDEGITLSNGQGIKCLAPSIKSLTKLKTLDLSGNSFSSGNGIKLLGSVLGHLTRLEELNLSETHLSRKDAEIIIPPLKSLSSLCRLNFRDNRLGCEGALCLSEVLPYLTNLQILNFSYNAIAYEADYDEDYVESFEYTTDGIRSLVKALILLPNLKTLIMKERDEAELESNEISYIKNAFKNKDVKLIL